DTCLYGDSQVCQRPPGLANLARRPRPPPAPSIPLAATPPGSPLNSVHPSSFRIPSEAVFRLEEHALHGQLGFAVAQAADVPPALPFVAEGRAQPAAEERPGVFQASADAQHRHRLRALQQRRPAHRRTAQETDLLEVLVDPAPHGPALDPA